MPGPIGPNPGMMAAQRAAQQAAQNAQQAAQRASMSAQRSAQQASRQAAQNAQQAAQRASMSAQRSAQQAAQRAAQQASLRSTRQTPLSAPLHTRQATDFRSSQTQQHSSNSGFAPGTWLAWIVIIGILVLACWLFFSSAV